MKQHFYTATTTWTGNKGSGTKDYRSYERSHTISIDDKPDIAGSSDAVFRGEKQKHNPEDLLVASLSGCHMLWYLHLCAVNQIVVLNYDDAAVGTMDENADGSGQFSRVVLRPVVNIAAGCDRAKAEALHHEAHKFCFIARSVNFAVDLEPRITGG